MDETLTVELTKEQRNLLLRGLRFIRSSVLLDMREPCSQVDELRAEQLQEIGSLVEQLRGSQPANPPVQV